MIGSAQTEISDRDYAILRGIAVHRPAGQRGYFALLRHKLETAEVATSAAAPDVAALERRLRYRIGDGPWLEHRLVIGPAREVFGQTVSLRSLPGLALIGLRAGSHFAFAVDGPTLIDVELDSVLQQPVAEDNQQPQPA